MHDTKDDALSRLFDTLGTEAPEGVRSRARELAGSFARSTDQLPLAPGDRAGPFEILSVLGAGGQAVVYEAIHETTRRRFALKVPRREAGDRIVREANLAARLEHPSIVALEDVSLDGALPFLVLELCLGGSLEERLDLASPVGLPLDQVHAIAVSVLEALAYAHDQGIVHRDVKPGNILFDAANKAKVSDFGIGTLARSDELVGSVGGSQNSLLAGTPLYLAPEQENPALRVDGRLDGRADLFAFGKVLFQILTGASPRTIRPPSRLVPALDPAWDDYVFKLTEEQPERRFASAREALAALPRPVLRPEPPVAVARPAGPPAERIGSCHLLALIERGPSGIVHRAFHEKLRCQVRVRLPDPEWPNSRGLVDYFAQVSRAMARVEHPNIARTLEVGTTPDGRPFVVVEDAGGWSLEQFVREKGRLEWREALKITIQVARALAAAGTVHRDVRPENILVDARGAAKLANFGLVSESNTRTKDRVTKIYVAPEVKDARDFDERADIFALGRVFQFMVSVFTTLEAKHILSARSTEFPGVPAQLIGIVRRMIEPDRERRYATARALLGDLEAFETGILRPEAWTQAVMAPPPPPSPPAARPRWTPLAKTLSVASAVAGLASFSTCLAGHWLIGVLLVPVAGGLLMGALRASGLVRGPSPFTPAGERHLAHRGDRLLRFAPSAWMVTFLAFFALALAGVPRGPYRAVYEHGLPPSLVPAAILFAVNWVLFLPFEFALIFGAQKRYPALQSVTTSTIRQRLLGALPVLLLLLSFFGALSWGVGFFSGPPWTTRPDEVSLGALSFEILARYSGALASLVIFTLWRFEGGLMAPARRR